MKRTQTLLAHLLPNVQQQKFDDGPNLLTANKLSSQIANLSPFLQGGFEPVRKEYENAQCSVTFGRIPSDLDGMYCKNGPNSYFDPPADAPYHWFDGDGMLHGVDIRNGKAIYTNRYVMSKRLQQDKARGNSVYNMGALNSGDLSATLDERVMDSNGRLYGRMNTNVSSKHIFFFCKSQLIAKYFRSSFMDIVYWLWRKQICRITFPRLGWRLLDNIISSVNWIIR